MRNFTSKNYPSGECRSYGRLMKALLLSTAMVLFHFTSLQAQESVNQEQATENNETTTSYSGGEYTPDPSLYNNLDALHNSGYAKDGDGSLPETAENPTLSSNSNCDDLRIILVLDESGSMNGAAAQEARESALVLAQSFQNTDASLRILEFSAEARFVDLGGTTVNNTYLSNFEAYLNGGFNGEEYASIPGGAQADCFPGYTNWDDAFQTISELPFEETPKLVLFLTDGNPTAYNGGPDFDECGYTVSVSPNAVEEEVIMESLAAAITASNTVKSNLTKIFPIGVGNGVNVNNLQLISGSQPFDGDIFNDDYAVGDIEDIQTNLTAGINSICGTVLDFEKSADITEVCNGDQVITFTFSVTNVGFDNGVERDAANVVITDVFPDAFDILEESLPSGAVLEGQTLTYTIESLAFDDTDEIEVQATLTENGEFTNTAYVDANNANEVSDSEIVLRAEELAADSTFVSCGSFEWLETGEVFNSTGEFQRSIENEAGCTVNVSLDITINEEQEPIVRTVESCGSYAWFEEGEQLGTEPFTASSTPGNPYIGTITGEDGECDQVYLLNLTIFDAPHTDLVESYCGPLLDPNTFVVGFTPEVPGVDGIIWDGAPYTQSGVYTGTLDVEDGCNETYTIYLTINSEEEVGNPCPVLGDEPSNFSGTTTDNCGCEGAPEVEDCNGDLGGNAYTDECGDCVGGNTGEIPCEQDCNGDFGGNAFTDECGVCVGGNTGEVACEQDCNGDFGGTAFEDECGECVGGNTDLEPCEEDCNGDFGGTAFEDECGECVGGNTELEPCEEDCNGDFGGTAFEDECGECVGGNTELEPCEEDCNGDFGGTAFEDECGECVGGNTDLEPCEEDCNGDFGGEAGEGTPCETNDVAGFFDENCECVPENNPEIIDCDDWVVYLADIVSGGVTDIYEVDFSGGNASLSLIATSQIQVHIAYNAQDNLIYAVSNADGSYRTLNPHDENPEFSETTFIEADINRVTQAAINADGKLIIGNSGSDIVYSINLDNNNVAVFDSYAPIEGGDIVFGQDGTPFMATKEGNGGLYVLWPDEVQSDVLIGDLPGNVTGMALSSTNQLLVSNDGSTSFLVRELNGTDNGETIDILLDGSPFPLSAGDMASGCSTFSNPNEGDCNDFSTFYANHGPGISGTDIYGVTYSGTNAVLSSIGNVGFQAHIAYNAEENIIYLVNANGSNIVLLDPDAGIQGSVPINGSINQLFAVVYNPSDELLYVGDANDDEIYTLDPVTGDIVLYSEGSSVDGGDLALQDGKLYLADRSGRDLYEVIAGADNDVLVGELPSNVNGMAQANNVTGLVVSRANTDEFVEVDAADGATIQTYTAILDGESFSLSNGDMAAGCGDADDVDVCADSGECYGVTADYVQGTTQGGGGLVANRANPANALGEPEGTDALVFTTLGYGGSLTFQFDGVVPNGPGDDIEVVETSFNNPGCESYPEYADVSVSVDGSTYYYLGTVCKGDPFVDISDADVEIPFECVSYVRVANNDSLTTSPDGFDVDGIVALHNCDDDGDDEETALTSVDADNTLTSFPNPTSGLSQAVFITAETERATLEVYDMNGRLVETLFNQVANANQEYRVDFDGMNLPNGVFVYRLTTDSEVTVEKFMIAR